MTVGRRRALKQKTRSIVAIALVCAPMSLGVFTSACWSYEASGSAAGSGGSGGSSGGASGGSTSGGSGGSVAPGTLPCDVLSAAGLPCVSAHSTVRRLVRDYAGSLYQVQRSDQTTLDIGVVDGYADAAAQDAFCAGSSCVITIIYDQAPFGNHLTPAPPGSAKPTRGRPAPADRLKITANGHSVYGILFRPGEGYRANCYDCPYPSSGVPGTAVGDEPQTMYMVSSQQDLVNGCCFDYGNAEVTANNDREGTMEAVYLGEGVIWGTGVQGGPWVMADLENGLYAGWENGQDRNISTATPLRYDFVTAVVVGDTAEKNGGKGRFALYGGDATTGGLTTTYDGIRPEKPGYVPMQKQGSIILSIGGDNSDFDGGRFYEGVVANGAASKATVDALQQTIVAAGYGK
jgi:non-reducing end alpha-L-arabinofuranosidase